MIRTELKRGTAELAVLSVLQEGPLHGYEIGRRIEVQSKGTLRYTLAALYPYTGWSIVGGCAAIGRRGPAESVGGATACCRAGEKC
ncbi:MAG TPA: hypothetical protein VJX72_11545 [Candidatus Acidoferrum sp.]|nr:hypothetical protein [Candidatus Acidoferrum sp.]